MCRNCAVDVKSKYKSRKSKAMKAVLKAIREKAVEWLTMFKTVQMECLD